MLFYIQPCPPCLLQPSVRLGDCSHHDQRRLQHARQDHELCHQGEHCRSLTLMISTVYNMLAKIMSSVTKVSIAIVLLSHTD